MGVPAYETVYLWIQVGREEDDLGWFVFWAGVVVRVWTVVFIGRFVVDCRSHHGQFFFVCGLVSGLASARV